MPIRPLLLLSALVVSVITISCGAVGNVSDVQREVTALTGSTVSVRMNTTSGVSSVVLTLERLPADPAAAKRGIEAIVKRHVPDAKHIAVYAKL